ncbi:MAG: cryptochrome/photolyase family protein, partial [Arcobacteraceae bacterium]
MQDIFIIYPHQLFEDITQLKNKKVLLVEEPLFFTQYTFHIQKLVLHRASMKFYESYLLNNNIDIQYYETEDYLEHYKNNKVYIYDVVDDWLLKKIQKNFSNLTLYYNPNFLNVNDTNKFCHNYYINRRKELNLFIENGKPLGGKWSFDSDNRKKLPKDEKVPEIILYSNSFIDEAKEYCHKFDSIGVCEEFYYPITFDEAKQNLQYFLNEKFSNYGNYQDAIVKEEFFLYHSNISSSINIGLISLHTVISQIVNFDAPYNSKEGFIR